MKRLPGSISGAVVVGVFAALLWFERRRPLRRSIEPKLRHDVRNLALAGVAAAAVQIAQRPFVEPLAGIMERRRWGLVQRLRLPIWLEVPLAVVLLDYTLYVWHVLVHRVPWLWRFHAVHHVDLDLTSSTAIRFHFGEMIVSVPWRAAQVVVIGVSPLSLSIWQTALLLAILFQHSNIELPIEWERRLSRVLVTPRMHGIHHSIIEEETNSNWSSGLTVWDRLHRTLRPGIPHQDVIIGVPAYNRPEQVTLPEMVKMPFETQPEYWALPETTA